ncbi:MAG TPA: methyltransferase [Rheinheimera sp.]|uniref:tRNA1(Val) (adenine(37)-N6)-methyltransferase n=1 Tax=Rheinheimera sp. TaxID=1869214 RepID=UPI000ED84BE1|nr:methyltransferase [Rheinheimera sp.]HCU65022.1 methyltransferase [Rheinheimera sp.]
MSAGFRCKQFYVAHDACAMKVSTDALLLGAWTQVPTDGYLLDIGCGSGILSLMLAQRTTASVLLDAVELDSAAAIQAADNVRQSPWLDRIRVIKRDILTYPDSCDHPHQRRYRLIISNPPYFAQALKSKDEQRAKARHTDSLSFAGLLATAASLLCDDGQFSLILPADAAAQFWLLAQENGWWLQRATAVASSAEKPVSRLLMTLSRQQYSARLLSLAQAEPLLIHQVDGAYSADYRRLLRDFYLKF